MMFDGREGPTVQKCRQTSRIGWIDIARGLAMVMIAFGHASEAGPIQSWVYSFHVPVFFFLSGLLFSYKGSYRQLAKKKAIQIMVPYYVFGLLSIIAFAVFGSIAVDALGREDKDGTIGFNLAGLMYANGRVGMGYNQPLWFLPVLFALSLFAGIVAVLAGKIFHCVKARSAFYAATAIAIGFLGWLWTTALGNAPLPFGLETAANMAPFFFAGMFVRSWKGANFFNRGHGRLLAFVGIVVFCIGFAAALLNAQAGRINYVSDIFHNYLLFYIGTSGQGFAFLLACSLIKSCKPLEYIGKHTMAILVMHKFPIVLCQILLPRVLPSDLGLGNPITALAVSFLAIGLSLGVEKLLFDRWFPVALGKPRRKQNDSS